MNCRWLLLGVLLLFSCAPAPGNALLEGVSRAVPIEQVEVIVTIDPVETQQYCLQYAPWPQVLLSCIANACFVPACAIMFIDPDGTVKKCYVYSWINMEFLLEHEKRHCQGYADRFY